MLDTCVTCPANANAALLRAIIQFPVFYRDGVSALLKLKFHYFGFVVDRDVG